MGEVAEGAVLDLAVLSEGASEIIAGVGDALEGVGHFSNVDCFVVCVPYRQYLGANPG